MRKNRRKRKYIIITLTLIVFLMSVGYSAFQTNLKIKGTTRITGVWDVRITNVTAGTPTGSAENAAAPTWDNLTASMKAKLNKKGDAMEYDVTISNRGTVDAKLGEIIKENKSTNEAIKITFSNYIKGQRLSAGESTIVKVKIEYDSSYKGIVDYSTPAKAEVSFNYVQGEGSSTNPNNPAPTTHLITYNYEENGGTSSNAEDEYLNENTVIDLTTITATKEGWTFVGWNTNKNATTGINNVTLTNDINLYAIFKKEVTVTYTKNNEIQSIGKQQDNCTRYNNDATCDIILPSITGNEIDKKTAWYDGTNKIGKANGTFAASENITLQARNVPPAMIKSWEQYSETDFHNSDYKTYIISVEILDNVNIPAAATNSWNVAEEGYDEVLAWVIPDTNDNTRYHLYIGGEDGVIANPDSSYLFDNFRKLQTVDLSNFDTSNVTNMSSMFSSCSGLTELDLSSFNTSNVTNMSQMFYNCTHLIELDLSSFNTSNVTDMSSMFLWMNEIKTIYASDNFVTSSVTSSTNMFRYDSNLIGGYGTSYNSSNYTHTMAKLDKDGQAGYFTDKNDNLRSIPMLKSWTSSATTDFHSSTYKTKIISVETVTNTNVPANATESWDVSAWGNNSVKAWVIPDTNDSTKYHLYIGGEDGVIANPNSSNLFYQFTGLQTADLSDFDTSNVTNMSNMFYKCSSLTSIDLSDFNTAKVTDMSFMFCGCSNLVSLDLSIFNTSNVKNMKSMFVNCTSLKTIYASDNFVTSSVSINSNYSIFGGDTNLIGGYGTSYNSSNVFLSMAKIDKDGQTGYFTDKNDNLKSINLLKSWTYDAKTDFHSSTYKTKIISVETVTNTNVPANATESWDVSIWGNNAVKAWVIPDTNDSTKYHLYIGQNGGVIAHPNSSNLFYQFTGLQTADLSNVDTSNVTNMGSMFYGCSSLTDLDLSSFNTSNVINMSFMFYNCSSLTELDLSNFNTSNVTTMGSMFNNCSSLTDLELSSFNTSNVTTMGSMFYGCSSLISLNLSSFNTSNVTTMVSMFRGCSSLTELNLSSFNTLNVTNMNFMFYNCSSLTELDLSNFNTSNVTGMGSMFNGCSSLISLNLSSFNTSNVTTMVSMFDHCSSLTELDLSNFNTLNVTEMSYMFSSCSKIKTIYASNNFVISSVTSGNNMFLNCVKLAGGYGTSYSSSNCNHTMAKIDKEGQVGYFTDKNDNLRDEPILNKNPFSGIGSTYKSNIISVETVTNTNVPANATESWDVSVWGNNTVKAWVIPDTNDSTKYHLYIGGEDGVIANSDLSYLFSQFTGLQTVDLSNLDTSNVTDISRMFYNCSSLTELDLSSFNTSNVTNMSYMFYNCSSLTELDLLSFNTSNVTNMSYMFYNCSSLTELDLSNFYTLNVTNMSYMFYTCSSLTELDLSSFNTSNVTNMSRMFFSCSGLTELDLSSFNTSNVTDMSYMFYNCSGLTELDLSSFNTSNVTGMDSMFRDCSSLIELDLSSFNTSNVTTMQMLFQNCSKLTTIDVSSFNTSNVTEMGSMFSGCSLLKTIYASDNFVTTSVTNGSGMFANDRKLIGGNGTSYDSSAYTHTMAKIDKEGQAGYFTDSRYKISTAITSNSIKLTAPTSLSYGTVTKFEFSKDGGTTFIDNGTNNIYTFNGLTKNTIYTIVVRYTIGGNTYTSEIDVTTNDIATPTFTQTSPTSTSSDVTIFYPKECGTTLTCTYKKNNETPVTVTTKTIVVNFTANGELIAQVTDGTNTVSSTFTVVVGN